MFLLSPGALEPVETACEVLFVFSKHTPSSTRTPYGSPLCCLASMHRRDPVSQWHSAGPHDVLGRIPPPPLTHEGLAPPPLPFVSQPDERNCMAVQFNHCQVQRKEVPCVKFHDSQLIK